MNKELQLYGAVLATIKQFAEAGAEFSAYDVTQFIREQVNSGEWSLKNNQTNIQHADVREIVNEIMEHDLLNVLGSNYEFVLENTRSFSGKYYRKYRLEFIDTLADEDLDNEPGCCGCGDSPCGESKLNETATVGSDPALGWEEHLPRNHSAGEDALSGRGLGDCHFPIVIHSNGKTVKIFIE